MHSYSLNSCSCLKKPEKNRGLAGINPDCDTDAGISPFCDGKPRNWELIIEFVRIIPGKDEDEMTNT